MSTHSPSKREFIKKAAYAAPVVLSLQAYSSLAKAGSGNYESPHSQGEEERRRDARKAALCEAANRLRALFGLPPKDCF